MCRASSSLMPSAASAARCWVNVTVAGRCIWCSSWWSGLDRSGGAVRADVAGLGLRVDVRLAVASGGTGERDPAPRPEAGVAESSAALAALRLGLAVLDTDAVQGGHHWPPVVSA